MTASSRSTAVVPSSKDSTVAVVVTVDVVRVVVVAVAVAVLVAVVEVLALLARVVTSSTRSLFVPSLLRWSLDGVVSLARVLPLNLVGVLLLLLSGWGAAPPAESGWGAPPTQPRW